jgi:hypothetical protein
MVMVMVMEMAMAMVIVMLTLASVKLYMPALCCETQDGVIMLGNLPADRWLVVHWLYVTMESGSPRSHGGIGERKTNRSRHFPECWLCTWNIPSRH